MALIPDDELDKYGEWWKAQFESFPQLIYETLDPRTPSLVEGMTNAEVLTALESFGTILAIEANEGIAIMRKLFAKTISTRKAVQDYLDKLASDSEEYQRFFEKYPAKTDRDKVTASLRQAARKPFFPILSFLAELTKLDRNKCRSFIWALEAAGLLEFRFRGREDDPMSRQMALPEIWFPTLRVLEQESMEMDASSECLGKLLYMGFFRKGIQPYKPLGLMLFSERHGGKPNAAGDFEISEDDIRYCYATCNVPSHRSAVMMAHDSVKVDRLRFFSRADGKVRVIPSSRKAVMELVRARALVNLRSRGIEI